MSLYGNVKKVGSSTFQFDRQYNTRVAMDQAAATDGVYIGRYVLVEYGQRWVDTEGKNINYTLIENQGAARLEGVVQSDSFTNNANTDLQKYGATYDSTVWQKIYSDGTDKYIMVAELNAVTPRIEFIQEKPYLYRAPQEGEQQTDGIYYGTIDANGYLANAVEVKGAVEEFKKPSFDLGLDTELSYLLHLPTAVNLEVSNDTIDINSKGFDVAYSYGEKDKPSTIKWIPQGLNVDAQGNLTADSEVDTQKLYMNLTAFGDVMNTLYDLLYGKPNATPAELATGVETTGAAFGMEASAGYDASAIEGMNTETQFATESAGAFETTSSSVVGLPSVPSNELTSTIGAQYEGPYISPAN